MMRDQLSSRIKAIKRRVKDKDPTALDQANELATQHPDEPEVWRLVAFARSMGHDAAGAIAAVARLMQLSPLHPVMFFDRGSYHLELGNLSAAINDFTQGIALCEQLDDHYYHQALYFFRADVLIQLGRKSEARADLAHVRDGFTFWTTTLRTKAEMLAECDR